MMQMNSQKEKVLKLRISYWPNDANEFPERKSAETTYIILAQ